MQGRVLPAILEAAEDLSPDQALSGEALRTLWTLLCRLSPSVTVETGAGASTAVFSQLSDLHWAFTNDTGQQLGPEDPSVLYLSLYLKRGSKPKRLSIGKAFATGEVGAIPGKS